MDYQRVVVVMPLQTVSGRGIGVRVDLMIYRFRVSYRSFPPPHPVPVFKNTVLPNACSFRSTLLQLGGQKQRRRRGVSGTFSNDSLDLFSFRHLAHAHVAIVERQIEVSGHNILANGHRA